MTTIIIGSVFCHVLQGLYKRYIKSGLKNFISRKILRINN